MDAAGHDVGLRSTASAIYTTTAEQGGLRWGRWRLSSGVSAAGRGQITTEMAPLTDYYYAEDYHQQYLSDAKIRAGTATTGRTANDLPYRTR
ncbi:hypothetical protein GCM10020358_63040 [Amorphoplanes nipponensis]